MLRRRLPPDWFLALLLGVQVAYYVWHGDYARPAPPVSMAFWALLFTIGSLIWDGIQAIGQATLAVLSVSVNLLWAVVRTVYDGLSIAARGLLDGFRLSWKFIRALYDDVLRPAWQKFWKFVDWARDTLDRTFRPIIRTLLRVRDEILRIYDRFVRPVLDVIGVARKVLRVFSTLGLEWAKTLDRKLGQLEEKIDAPFRLLLREINKIINLVNTVVTANGLFQRLALVRSIARDFAVIGDEFARLHRTPMSPAELAARRALKFDGTDPAALGDELGKIYRGEHSVYSGAVGELVSTWRVAAGLDAARVP